MMELPTGFAVADLVQDFEDFGEPIVAVILLITVTVIIMKILKRAS